MENRIWKLCLTFSWSSFHFEFMSLGKARIHLFLYSASSPDILTRDLSLICHEGWRKELVNEPLNHSENCYLPRYKILLMISFFWLSVSPMMFKYFNLHENYHPIPYVYLPFLLILMNIDCLALILPLIYAYTSA